MKVFLDCNVFMDFYSGRQYCEEAAQILSMAQDGRIKASTSMICVSDIIYLFEKYKIIPKRLIPDAIKDLSSLVEVLPVGNDELQEALSMEYSRDLEDLLEISCAQRNGCDTIITINKRDFTQAEIPVYSPAEFLQRITE